MVIIIGGLIRLYVMILSSCDIKSAWCMTSRDNTIMGTFHLDAAIREHHPQPSHAQVTRAPIAEFIWLLFSLKNAPDKWSVERFFRHNSRLLSVCVSVTLLYSGINLSLTWSFTRGSLHLQTLVYHAKSGSPRNSTNFIHVHFHFPSGYRQNLTCSRSRERGAQRPCTALGAQLC